MALPKDWKPQERSRPPSSQMPRLSLLTRPMVVAQHLRIRGYPIRGMEMVEKETNTIMPTPNIKYFEIQPIELTHLLFFTDGRSKHGQSMEIRDISEIEVSSFTKGRFKKREDLVVEIRSLGPQDRRQYITTIDVDDKYADEIVREVMSSKEAELDSTYWSHRSLIFTTQYGQESVVDIYPLAPFLANGEEILWQNLITDPVDKNKKVIWIDTVTNYRIFQYGYREHKGAAILFPSVEDIKIGNEVRGSGFGQYNLNSPYLAGIQPSGGNGIAGEIVFYAQGSPWITFAYVNDPETLSNIVKTLKQQQSNVRIGNGESEQTVDHVHTEICDTKDLGQKVTALSCSTCGKNNPIESKFCNNCGSSLSPSCSKCGHSNPSGALFCARCGSKLTG